MAIKRCKEPFALTVDGVIRVISAGAIVSTDDPAYTKSTAAHFEDVDVYVADQTTKRQQASGVEQATAAPGEKRSVKPADPKSTAPTSG